MTTNVLKEYLSTIESSKVHLYEDDELESSLESLHSLEEIYEELDYTFEGLLYLSESIESQLQGQDIECNNGDLIDIAIESYTSRLGASLEATYEGNNKGKLITWITKIFNYHFRRNIEYVNT